MKDYDNSLVSVVIPCYNHEDYIAATINSVLDQTHKNLEILVGDDCSGDRSRSIIQQVKDPRIKYFFYEENVGTVLSLNFLLNQAKGDYICMLGSDDAFVPEKIEEQLETFRNNPALGAVFTDVQTVDENNIPYDEDAAISKIFREVNRTQAQWIRYFFETGNHLCHSSVMIPRKILEEIGDFQCAFRQLHDFDYWLRLLLKYPIELIPKQLTIYRRERTTNGSVSADLPENRIRLLNEYAFLFARLFETIPQSLFEDAFSDIISNRNTLDETSFLIERFKVLQRLTMGNEVISSAAEYFFLNNIASQLKKERNDVASANLLKQFYQLTGKPTAGDNYLYMEQKATIEQLNREIELIYSSKGWQMINVLRTIKNKLF